MESNYHKKITRQCFDGVAVGYDHPTLSFFHEIPKFLHKCLNFEQWNLKDIAEILGDVVLGLGLGFWLGLGRNNGY